MGVGARVCVRVRVWSVVKAQLKNYSLEHERMSRNVLDRCLKAGSSKSTTLLIGQLINGCSFLWVCLGVETIPLVC